MDIEVCCRMSGDIVSSGVEPSVSAAINGEERVKKPACDVLVSRVGRDALD